MRPLLTDDDLNRIAQTSSFVLKRRNVLVHGYLEHETRRASITLLRRGTKRMFGVLNDTTLSMYDNVEEWQLGSSPAIQIPADDITAVRRTSRKPTSIHVELTNPRRAARLIAPTYDQATRWLTALEIVRPARTPSATLARVLQNYQHDPVHSELINNLINDGDEMILLRFLHAVPWPATMVGMIEQCLFPACIGSPIAASKLCRLHKQMQQNVQLRAFVMQLSILREDSVVKLEAIIASVLAMPAGRARYLATILLWRLCSCEQPSNCIDTACNICSKGAERFLAYLAVHSRRHGVSQFVIDALFDILLGVNDINEGSRVHHDGRVRAPRAWTPILFLLGTMAPAARSKHMHAINALIIGNTFNCRTLTAQSGWQFSIYVALVSDRHPMDAEDAIVADNIIALGINVLAVACYDELINGKNFIGITCKTLLTLQVGGGLDATSLAIARTFLSSLLLKMSHGHQLAFSRDIDNGRWASVILFSNVVRSFLFNSAMWGANESTSVTMMNGISRQEQKANWMSVRKFVECITDRVRSLRHRPHEQRELLKKSRFPIRRRFGPHVERSGASSDMKLVLHTLELFMALKGILINDKIDETSPASDRFVEKDITAITDYMMNTIEALSSMTTVINDPAVLRQIAVRRLSLYH